MKRRRIIFKMLCCTFTLLFLFTGFSYAPAKGTDSPAQLELNMTLDNITVQKGQRKAVTVSVLPQFIETGVDCGMPDMCGIDPCLCGSCDSWGSCSCNGLKRTCPTVTATASAPGLLSVRVKDGKLLVKGIKEGESQVTVTASLKHFEPVSRTITVQVAPCETGKRLFIGGFILAAFAAVVLIIRKRT